MSLMKKVESGITSKCAKLVKKANAMQGFLNTVVYKEYQNAQRKRWITENVSEGKQWSALNAEYVKRKRRLFAAYEGGGNAMLIATGRLYKSIIGPSPDHRKITTTKSLTIYSTVPYTEFVNKKRDFTEFGRAFEKRIQEKLHSYFFKGAK